MAGSKILKKEDAALPNCSAPWNYLANRVEYMVRGVGRLEDIGGKVHNPSPTPSSVTQLSPLPGAWTREA